MASRTRLARTRSIRFMLVGLLIIPLVSLVALWGFAASVTLADTVAKRNYDVQNNKTGGPSQTLLVQLVQERQRRQTETEKALDAERGRAVQLARQADNLKDLIAKIEQGIAASARAAAAAQADTARPAVDPKSSSASLARRRARWYRPRGPPGRSSASCPGSAPPRRRW